MRAVAALAAAGLTALLAMLAVALLSGGNGNEAQVLIDSLWGRMLITDLYVGVALFSGWVLFREKALLKAIVWILLILVLTNVATTAYLLYTAWSSRGDWKRFFLGDRMPVIVTDFKDTILKASPEIRDAAPDARG